MATTSAVIVRAPGGHGASCITAGAGAVLGAAAFLTFAGSVSVLIGVGGVIVSSFALVVAAGTFAGSETTALVSPVAFSVEAGGEV